LIKIFKNMFRRQCR